MTYEEALAILGPELAARVAANVAAMPPFTAEQIDRLAPVLAPILDRPLPDDDSSQQPAA